MERNLTTLAHSWRSRIVLFFVKERVLTLYRYTAARRLFSEEAHDPSRYSSQQATIVFHSALCSVNVVQSSWRVRGPLLAKKQQQQSNGISDFIRELWQAAVNMRGSIEPADYKRYVLPIIFLRFLSLRYEKRRAELEAQINDPKSDYYGDIAALEDEAEYRAANTFVVPEKARWSYITKKVARRDDVKIQMDKILAADPPPRSDLFGNGARNHIPRGKVF